MNDIRNLYLVKLRGCHYAKTGPNYGTAYVVAEDSGDAYRKVREVVERGDIGFLADRALDTVQLIAEGAEYPECRIKLYL